MPGTQDATGPSTNGEPVKAAEPDQDGAKGEASAPGPGKHVCDVAFCPIGLALSAVQPIKPDVVEHLLVAGREFLLAAKAVIDARVGETDEQEAPPTFERIDIG